MSQKSSTLSTQQLLELVYNRQKTPKEQNFVREVLKFINIKSDYLSRSSTPNELGQITNQQIEICKKKVEERSRPKIIPNPKKNQINVEKIQKSENISKENKTIKKEEMKEEEIEKQKPKEDNNNNNSNDDNNDDDDDDDKPKGIKPNSMKGGSTEKYEWGQTLKEIEIKIDVPSNLRGRHFNVKIEKNHLYVGIKNDKNWIVSGEFFQAVDTQNTTWTLDQEYGKKDKTMTIIIGKITKDGWGDWWKYLLKGEEEIDISNLVGEGDITENMDDEAQKKVKKAMYEHRLKQMGIPTQEEKEKAKILEGLREHIRKTEGREVDFSGKNAPKMMRTQGPF